MDEALASTPTPLAALGEGARRISAVPPGVALLLERRREEFLEVAHDSHAIVELSTVLSEQVRRFLLLHHQYLPWPAAADDALQRLVRSGVERVLMALASPTGQEFYAGLSATQEDLLRSLSKLLTLLWQGPDEARGFVFRDVVYSEYSPELQLAVLGIDLKTVREPILDIGCGVRAPLVHHLRGLGLSASGIDRLVEPSSGIVRADFIEYDFGRAAWGTIISHMSFTTHVLLADRCGPRYAAPLVRRYLDVLAALMPRGAFHYAPSLPFIEQHLDSRAYRLHRVPVDARTSAAHRLASDGFLSATRVERLE